MSTIVPVPLEVAFAQFLRRHVPLGPVDGCGGIRLHQAYSLDATWSALSTDWPGVGATPPYWAVAWPAGRALARHLLDEPGAVRGLTVLDLGCGGAVAGIAAALAGARRVCAVDIDALACRAAAANAEANGVPLEVRRADVLDEAPLEAWDVVLAADLWYERFLARRASAWLRERAAAGAHVLLADVGRAFAPRSGLQMLRRIELSDPHGTERSSRPCVEISVLLPDPGLRV